MNAVNRLMVGLDLTVMDETLIRYAAFMCSCFPVEKVYFLHVERNLDIPQEILLDTGSSHMPADERFCDLLEDKLRPYFEQLPHVQVRVQVVEGSPLKELLHWSKVKHIDLIMVGRKFRLKGSGLLPGKLLRTGRVSILFIPENAETVLKRVVVSIDFSEYSTMALEHVLRLTNTQPGIEIICMHVYQVPPGYITLGISYDEFDRRMQGFANEKFERVLERFPELGSHANLRLVKQQQDEVAGELIVLEAKRAKADLLVIGAKGKSAAALFVLGSTTEKVLRYNDDIPLIVFKKRDEEIGFLDAIISGD
ncbi:universal stress protein [Pontibacter vulgaris]|uniref:universal stress protein n=1 Tax=Pontibacter vulgaris TaxID=2905679 RepID=UPI001FA7FA02|nr:universal stress protein [Pontibacter vulgaris]